MLLKDVSVKVNGKKGKGRFEYIERRGALMKGQKRRGILLLILGSYTKCL